MQITIDGEKYEVYEVTSVTYGVEVKTEDGTFLIFSSAAEAGRAARLYWENMAQDDPEEFACLVGTDTLVAWALGQHAGPGTVHVTCLEDWLDLFLDSPAEEWNREDGYTELEICIDDSETADVIGFDGPAVGYPR